MSKRRWVLALSVWLFAIGLAAIIAIIGVKLFLDARARDQAPPPVTEPIPQPTPDIPPSPKAPINGVDGGINPPKKPVPKAIPKADVDDGGKIALCPGVSRETIAMSADGTMLGHKPYANASANDLASPPAGFGSGNCAQMQGEAKIALERMIAAARVSDPAIGDAMVGLSCFRSSTYQKEVFCRKVGDGFAARARASAPPGYSEHATGYAIDIGDRTAPECNLNPCFADTPVGVWLSANASNYGFVLSFPKGNAQGVMYEPWHWRYEGSGAAKAVFAGAP